MNPTQPTMGQKRILQFAARANRRLRGHRDVTTGEVTYRIVELYPLPPSREVMTVARAMVTSLLAAGWIEVAPGGNRMDFEFRVTQTGIVAANS